MEDTTKYKDALMKILNYKQEIRKDFIMHSEFKKFAIAVAEEAIGHK